MMNYTKDILKQLPVPLTEFLEHYLTEASDTVKAQVEDYVQDLLEHVTNLEEELELMERFANDMEDQAAKLYWAIEDSYEYNEDDPVIATLKKKADEIAHQ